MEGFFYKEEKKKSKSPRESGKKSSGSKKIGCDRCGLYKTCLSPKMRYTGKGRKKILIVGEAPGRIEDEQGEQFVGEAGETVRERLKNNHIVLDRDCYKTNGVICRPPKNATPTNTQIQACRHHLLKTVEELKPEKIICFGKIPLQALICHKESISGLGKYTGWKIPDQEFKTWIYVNYHPSYLNRNERDKALSNYFDKVLQEAIEHDEPFPKIEPNIQILYDELQIKKKLEYILKNNNLITFDYETTGKRPYRKGHKIFCISIATDNETIAFPFDINASYVDTFKYILSATGIRKVAQNIKFEDLWSSKILNVKINNWYWDTMLATHIIDNRTGITSLKFQTYVNFGIAGYEDEVKPYLDNVDDDDLYGFNRIEECDLDKVLYYNGEDSFYEHLLFKKQLKHPNLAKNINGFGLLMDGTLRLKETEKYGISTDQVYYKEQFKDISRKIKLLKSKLDDSKEMKIWRENEGDKKINLDSPVQLKKLLFDYCDYKSVKQTKKGNASTDEEALEHIKTSFTKNLIRLRKNEKIKNTYIKNFIIKADDKGFLHPNFNLNIVISYRSSSDNPNWQNIPIHDENANKLTRSGIKPRKGRKIAELDFKGVEVRGSACYHHDPVMIKYIEDPKTDMHRDMAEQIFMITPDDVDPKLFKELRFFSKNKFVFPEFYGDYYKQCAANIWKDSSQEVKQLLKQNGIKNYMDFEYHLANIEDDFWNNRFKVFHKWREQTWEEYLKTMEINLLTGFTCRGYMRKNEVLSLAIQGTSFHFLLWSYIKISDYLHKNKFETLPMGQIHDSILLDIVPDEEQEVYKVARQIMTKDIREFWKWIIVPLDIDIETTPIDGNWSQKKKEVA